MKKIVYSPSEVRLIGILKALAGKPTLAEDIARFMYKKGTAPYHATRVVGMTLKSLAGKLKKNNELFVLKKSKRRGPYPIDYWLEKR